MTTEERNEILSEAANAARTALVMHGDPLRGLLTHLPRTGEDIARAIEVLKA